MAERTAGFEAGSIATVITDRDQRVIFADSGVGPLLGVCPSVIVGMPCWELMRGQDETGDYVCRKACYPLKCIRDGLPIPKCVISVARNLERPTWISVQHYPGPHGIVHSIEDVTAEVEARRILRMFGRLMDSVALDCDTRATLHGALTGLDLTEREVDVVAHLIAGRSPTEMARDMVVSLNTVNNHIQRVLLKLELHSRSQILPLVLRHVVRAWQRCDRASQGVTPESPDQIA